MAWGLFVWNNTVNYKVIMPQKIEVPLSMLNKFEIFLEGDSILCNDTQEQ